MTRFLEEGVATQLRVTKYPSSLSVESPQEKDDQSASEGTKQGVRCTEISFFHSFEVTPFSRTMSLFSSWGLRPRLTGPDQARRFKQDFQRSFGQEKKLECSSEEYQT